MEEPLESFDQPPASPKMPLGKVAAVNFGISLLLMLISSASMGIKNGDWLIGFLMSVMAQAGINFIVGLVFQFFPARQKVGQAMLICSFLVMILGFGMCVLSLVSNG